MGDYGIDSKPKTRTASARSNRRKLNLEERGDAVIDGFDDNDASSELNIRVKDRAGDDVVTPGKKSRMGNIFKEVPIKGFKEGAADALKRPLTGIFRRPGSRSGRKREEVDSLASGGGQGPSFVDERSLSPEPTATIRMRDDTSPAEYDAIARAPHLTASQLHGMLQIDAFASKYSHLAKLDDIDISLLSRYLYTEEETKDEDVPWTWDYLFASVSSELREEWAQEEADDS